MTNLVQDVRYALRVLARSPGFTVVAILTLALGIGANTAIFSVVNAVLLKPLPYPDPEGLMVFMTTAPQGPNPGGSPTKFNVWRRQSGAFQDVSAYRFNTVNLTEGNNPEQIAAGHVSADFFRLFGAPVAAGRTFAADEDRPDGGRFVILSEGFWRRRFGSDRTIVGRTLSINGDPHVVLGILGRFDTQALQTQASGPLKSGCPFKLTLLAPCKGTSSPVPGGSSPA